MNDDQHANQDRMRALEERIAALEAENQRLAASQEMLRAILDAAPSVVYLKEPDGTYLFINRRYREMVNMTSEQLIGKTDYDYLPAEAADGYRAKDEAVISSGQQHESEEFVEGPDGVRTYLSIKFPMMTAAGLGVAGISTDITESKAMEQRQVQLQEQIIQLQEATLAELSTPIIPVTEEILVMPLIGTIDSQRSMHILERLLEQAASHHASTMIIDITGVPIVDSQVAGVFIKAAQAVQLLGVEVVLTGIRPEVAQTLVSLGFNIQVPTYSSLQAAIAALLSQGRRR